MLALTATLSEVIAAYNAEVASLGPMIRGWRRDATTLYLRFLAALDTPWVIVHVQSTNTGGAAYTPSTFISHTQVDCRAARRQDISTPDIPAERLYVFLIPVQQDGAGQFVVYDGQGGRPDMMSFVDLGA